MWAQRQEGHSGWFTGAGGRGRGAGSGGGGHKEPKAEKTAPAAAPGSEAETSHCTEGLESSARGGGLFPSLSPEKAGDICPRRPPAGAGPGQLWVAADPGPWGEGQGGGRTCRNQGAARQHGHRGPHVGPPHPQSWLRRAEGREGGSAQSMAGACGGGGRAWTLCTRRAFSGLSHPDCLSLPTWLLLALSSHHCPLPDIPSGLPERGSPSCQPAPGPPPPQSLLPEVLRPLQPAQRARRGFALPEGGARPGN